jgi:hypothetical protein
MRCLGYLFEEFLMKYTGQSSIIAAINGLLFLTVQERNSLVAIAKTIPEYTIHHHKALVMLGAFKDSIEIKIVQTYLSIDKRTGIHFHSQRHALGIYQEICRAENWPQLTSIVVNTKTRKPGAEFVGLTYTKRTLSSEQNLVFSHKWNWYALAELIIRAD